MCGICGIVQFDGRPIEQGVVEAMTERLAHRGPDDAGVWVEARNGTSVALGHRRLSIIDLSQLGHQPMSIENGTLWITYNGEVYNFQSLRAELMERGHRFRSHSDTEVLLHLYQEYGIDCLPKLNGMFAFAIWDREKQQLFVVRDRVGVKPLVYFWDKERFTFASELKALLADPDVPRQLDPTALDLYLTFKVVPHPYTIYRQIRKLPPGHYLIVGREGIEACRYWDAAPAEKAPRRLWTFAEAKAELRRLVTDAVRLRLIADVPVGAFLSGGIDSSVMVGLMARQASEPIRTFTIGYDDPTIPALYDESDYAREVAELNHTDHTQLRLTAAEVREALPTVLDHLDEPFAPPSSLPTFLVSKLARSRVKVALSGDGPDELFAGYRAYLAERLTDYYLRVPGALRRGLIEPIVKVAPTSDKWFLTRTMRRAHRFLDGLDQAPARRWYRMLSACNASERATVLASELVEEIKGDVGEHLVAQYYESSALDGDTLNRLLYTDVNLKLVDHILTKVDWMSMCHGLEVRVPFLDYRIVNFAFELPGRFKLHYGTKKYLLLETFKDLLPARIRHRPKRGFTPPVGEWLKRDFRDMFLDVVSPPLGGGGLNYVMIRRMYEDHCAERRDYQQQLWALFVLKWWARKQQLPL